MRRRTRSGFTLVECVIASAITAVAFLGTLYCLGLARMHNALEQERARAHQIVCQTLEIERYKLFTWSETDRVRTIWDNGTPENPNDDIQGVLDVIVRDSATGAELHKGDPISWEMLMEIEATIEWSPPGRRSDKILRETAMTYKAP